MPTLAIPASISLPSGGTVDFHDVEDLTGDDVDTIIDTLKVDLNPLLTDSPNIDDFVAGAMKGGGVMSMISNMQKAIAAVLVKAWDIPYTPKGTDYPPHETPIPEQQPGILGKLRIGDRKAIFTAVMPALSVLLPGPVTPDDADKPDSPTEPTDG